MRLSKEQELERQKLVHPKFITRWARRFCEVQRERGRAEAIREMNKFLNPNDAQAVGREARRLQDLYPNLRPTSSS